MELDKIAIIGTGYVGLTTGACLSYLGNSVICMDSNKEKIAQLSQGHVSILEENLPELVNNGISSGRLRFTDSLADAVSLANYVFICLPTPQGENGEPDLSKLWEVSNKIKSLLSPRSIVIVKSTAPVGTAGRIAQLVDRHDISVAANPEFLREGTAIFDFLHPDRIVIGADSHAISTQIADLYQKINAPLLLVATKTAELIKYASNAFLATKISFANSISNLCESVGANAHEVLEGIGYDKRIGRSFLKPGPGWGGSCFPKDTLGLIQMSRKAGFNFELLEAVVKTNQIQLDLVVDRASLLLGGRISESNIAVWGLSFKAGTNDIRQSPALKVIDRLRSMGAHIAAYDPGTASGIPASDYRPDPLATCDGADLLMVLTEWPEFSRVPLSSVAKRMRAKRVLDARNMLDTNILRTMGFSYYSVGNYQAYAVLE